MFAKGSYVSAQLRKAKAHRYESRPIVHQKSGLLPEDKRIPLKLPFAELLLLLDTAAAITPASPLFPAHGTLNSQFSAMGLNTEHSPSGVGGGHSLLGRL